MSRITFCFSFVCGILILSIFAFPGFGQSQNLKMQGEFKTIVFLVRYLDSPNPPPFTPEQVQEAIFQGGLAGYVKEASSGLALVSGKVSGWHTLQRNAVDQDKIRGCYLPQSSDIKEMAASEGVNLPDYDRIVALNLCPHFGGSFGNIANVNVWDKSLDFMAGFPFPWRIMDRALVHEYGHGLGLPHASTWNCEEGVSLGGSQCTLVEYGNLFDIMGSGKYGLHINASDKNAKLGWLDDSSVLPIRESGTYSLAPLETGNGARLAKIQTKDGSLTPFFIEYRRAIGFDARLNQAVSAWNEQGIFVYWQGPPGANKPLLLDMSPDKDRVKVTLNVGEGSFQDRGTGVTIGPVHSADADSVSFDVAIDQPECVRGSPISFYSIFSTLSGRGPFTLFTKPGSKEFVTFPFLSGDSFSCAAAEITVAVQPPPGIEVSTAASGWKNSLLEIFSMGPLTEKRFLFNIQASSELGVGEHLIPVTVTNQASGLSLEGKVLLKVTTSPLSVDLKAAAAGGPPADGPLAILPDEEVTLSWETTNAEACFLSWKEFQGGKGAEALVGRSGSLSTGKLIGDRVYQLRCVDPSFEYARQDSVDIKVQGASPMPAIIVSAPNGGELWEIGTEQAITWNSRGVSAVNIDLLKGGAFNQKIAANQINDEQYEWIIPLAAQGNDFQIRVTDVSNASVSDQSDGMFFLKEPSKVGENTAPEVLVDEEASGITDELLVLPLSVADADGDVLTVQAVGLPEGARFIPLGDVNLDGAVNFFDVQRFIQFRVGLVELDAFELQVADANEDGAVDIKDSVAVSQLAEGIAPLTKHRLVWQPGGAQAGSYEVTFLASDGKELVQKTTTIRVQAPNLPPVLDVISEHTVKAGQLLVVPALASDHESDILAFAAENLPAGAYFTPLGDANLDGRLNAFDVTMLSQFVAGSANPTPLQFSVADMNADDTVNTQDIVLLKQLVDGAVPITQYRLLWQTSLADAGEYVVTLSVNDGSSLVQETVTIRVQKPVLPLLELSLDRSHIFQDNPEPLSLRGEGIGAGGTFFFRFKQGDDTRAAFVFTAREDAVLQIDFSSKKEELEALASGFYDIEIERGANNVAVIIKDFLVTRRGDIPDKDGKRDAKVDIFDVSRMLLHFGTISGEPDYSADADINPGPNDISKDKVDLFDANKLMANWTEQ